MREEMANYVWPSPPKVRSLPTLACRRADTMSPGASVASHKGMQTSCHHCAPHPQVRLGIAQLQQQA